MRYRASGTWFDQDGIVIGSGYRRVGGRANLDFDASSRPHFSTSLAISGERNNRVEGDGSIDGIMTNAVGQLPADAGAPRRSAPSPRGAGLQLPNPVALGHPRTAPGPAPPASWATSRPAC